MGKIKIIFEVEITNGDDDLREKTLSVLAASISDTIRHTIKRLNFWSSSWDKVKYKMDIKTERQ